MNILNLIDPITDIIIYYYSLFRNFKVTKNLRNSIKSSFIDLWNNYIFENGISWDEVDSIDLFCGIHEKRYTDFNIDIFQEITYEIISYFDNEYPFYPGMTILSINPVPFDGLSITHEMISCIIEFHLHG